MAPKNEFSARAKDRMLKDARDAVKERDRTIILLTAEKKDARDHVDRLQKQLGRDRTNYEDRLAFLDRSYGEEMSRVRKLQSIIKVLEATIFCLTKKALQIDSDEGGHLKKHLQVIDGAYKPSGNGGFSGATPEPST